MLYLQHSLDDLARLRNRTTVANAPATAFGDMRAAKDAFVSNPLCISSLASTKHISLSTKPTSYTMPKASQGSSS